MTELHLPQGFRASGVRAGIKAAETQDLSLFVSDVPCVSGGVFTQNQVVGAPVIVSRSRLPSNTIRAVVINSGNANACTGERGLTDAKRMAATVAEQLEVDETAILVCSTGVIGHFLPMEKINRGIRSAATELGSTTAHLQNAAKGIMTTDSCEKIVTRTIEVDGQSATVTGVAKGAAMIAPNMATMLAVVMTDAELTDAADAAAMIKSAADVSFNNISVEGHTSTSDTVLFLANGTSGVNFDAADKRTLLQNAVSDVCRELAQKIIRDAEGAEHFVTVQVSGLPVIEDARKIAKVVCESPLVKTAITGNDPNWGRIVSAAGYSGVTFRETDVSLVLNGVVIYDNGRPAAFDEASLSESMQQGEVNIHLKFRLGPASITYWTCDLTAKYISLNADYTT